MRAIADDLRGLAERFCKMNCPVHATEQGWPHDPDCETLQAAVRAIDAPISPLQPTPPAEGGV